jgi:predicted protein tyrosine phosphatase
MSGQRAARNAPLVEARSETQGRFLLRVAHKTEMHFALGARAADNAKTVAIPQRIAEPCRSCVGFMDFGGGLRCGEIGDRQANVMQRLAHTVSPSTQAAPCRCCGLTWLAFTAKPVLMTRAEARNIVRLVSPETIYVCPMDALGQSADHQRAGHMVTLVNAEAMRDVHTPAHVLPERHLRLVMNDIAEPRDGLIPPGMSHVEALVDFAMTWDRSAPILVHCLAGVSRSTAATLIMLSVLNPDTPEHQIARVLKDASPTAQPNRLLVGIADERLGREGRLLHAAEAIARTALLESARPFSVPARIDPAG